MFRKISSLITLTVTIVIVLFIYNVYEENNYGEFSRAEMVPYTSIFLRDSQVKYSDSRSYKIESAVFNDALFFKKIEVKPNTPYKVTAMVKTKNVTTENQHSLSGAQICIYDTVESSKSVVGTSDWQKVEFMFDSKNRENVSICFRLGGFDDNVTGTAWFSDITLEEGGRITEDTNWNFVCLIFKKVDVEVNINGEDKHVYLEMNSQDEALMKDNINRFKNSAASLSADNMSVNYDIYTIDEAITSLSYSEENAYFVEPKNILPILEEYTKEKQYDHIFIAVRLRR